MARHELIETARLRLTRPRLEDAPEIFSRYASDPDVVTYVGFRRHHAVADSEQFIRYSDDAWARAGAGPFVVSLRSDGRLLGGTGLGFEGGDVVSTGYVLAREAWGQGYASESLRAMIDLAGAMGVPRLIAHCHPDHRASARVLEKAGFAVDADAIALLEFPNLSPGAQIPALVYTLSLS